MTLSTEATVAVIGGSGLYRLFDANKSVQRRIATPYGTADVSIGEIGGRAVAFLTRHGVDHSVAPHLINYRANIWALASIGVKAIVSSAAVGGVNPDFPPGTLVLSDQFIDRTHGRADTFFDQFSVQHLSAADPFCPTLREIASEALTRAGEVFASHGTVVVIQGPRFSTRAESNWFRAAGAHTVNMTLYPEVPLAAELNIGTVNLSFVTDSDSGLTPPSKPATPEATQRHAREDADTDSEPRAEPGAEADADAVSAQLVFARLAAAQPRIVAALEAIIAAIPVEYEPRTLIAPAAVESVMQRPAI